MSGFTPPGECPVCGAEVPAKARACPECGACAETGWSDDTHLDGVDLPDAEDAQDRPPPGGHPGAWLGAIALLTVIAIILVFVLGRG